MIEVKHNGYKIEMYDSIEEMPVENFQQYNKFALLESGIGSDLEAVSKHVLSTIRLVQTKRTAQAVTQLQNINQAVHFIVSKNSPEMLAFASLVYKIDGKLMLDLTDDGLEKTLKLVNKSRLKVGKIRSLLNAVKKKLRPN